MWFRVTTVLLLLSFAASAVIIDRMAIVIGNRIIKESDIKRDLRVTSFLNNETPDLSLASQRKAANRLIDQVFIRREIELGDYPRATLQQADQQLDRLKDERFKSSAAFDQTLGKYDLTALDLRTHFQWELTVLRFVDARFRPAVLITSDDLDKYYRDHAASLRRQYPTQSSRADMRAQIRRILTDEKVNQQFFAWLDEQRKDAKIQFLEEDLR